MSLREYELILVLSPDLTAENAKKLLTRIEKLIIGLKGKVKQKTEWGRKKFSYPIKKKPEGDYFLWELTFSPGDWEKAEKKLKLEEELLRYLLIKKETPRQTQGKGGKHGAKVA